jgi:hypothetical protein
VKPRVAELAIEPARPQHTTNVIAQQPPIDRLGDEGIRAEAVGAIDGDDIFVPGQHDDRQVTELGFRSDLLEQREAVGSRHDDIQ